MNILLVRPDGIGDEILALPVATELHRLLPQSRVSFLSSVYAAPVLAHHPDLDEVRTVNGQERFAELIALFRRNVDAAVFLKPYRRLMAAAWVARVPLRAGTGYRWYSCLLNRCVYEHRSNFARHESASNLGLLRGLGLVPGAAEPPRLVVTAEERRWAQACLGGSAERRVVVHPGAFSSRLWKAEHFRDLALRLAREGHEVILTGDQAEAERFETETATSKWPEGVRNLMGLLTLRQLLAIIAETAVVVSMATGPMHMAAALGVPGVSLFDPRRNVSPTRWQPLGRGALLLPAVPTCEKCVFEACPYWDCLDRITVETVMARINEMLAPSAETGQPVIARV